MNKIMLFVCYPYEYNLLIKLQQQQKVLLCKKLSTLFANVEMLFQLHFASMVRPFRCARAHQLHFLQTT